jgi:hypothetical protein
LILRTSMIIGTIMIMLVGSSRISTASSEEYEDVCGPNYFQNKDGKCIPDNEFRKNLAIVTALNYMHKIYCLEHGVIRYYDN